jgi:sulfate transport system permease protein
MADTRVVSRVHRELTRRDRDATDEPMLARALLIAAAVLVLSLFLLVPLAAICFEAFRKGIAVYAAAISDPLTVAAVWLTLTVAAICVPVNTICGIAAAWAVTRFELPGKNALVTLIDLPFSISPVVAGLAYVLLFGAQGYLGPWLDRHHIQILFALPGIVLATSFVTFPFVARELIPLMQQQGSDDEQAALTLGASPLRMFLTVTLPNIKWGLLYGILLCNARAMGEFGAVAVVSGRIRGLTNTLPLHVQALYDGNDLAGAFAVASILAALALVTLVVKAALEWRFADEIAAARRL